MKTIKRTRKKSATPKPISENQYRIIRAKTQHKGSRFSPPPPPLKGGHIKKTKKR